MTRVVISGATGRLGRAVARLAADEGVVRVVGGIARRTDAEVPGIPELVTLERARDLVAEADVLLDVSRPEALERLLEVAPLDGRALVVGTTGMGAELERRLAAVAERSAVVVAANFSAGVNVLLTLIGRAASLLNADGWDVEVAEAHHAGKADAPSGTALALVQAIAQARGADPDRVRRDGRSGMAAGARPPGEIGVHALRGGGVVGDHRVYFLAARERIELAHMAQDRDVFAEGALRTAAWVAGRPPGRYAMSDVLGL